MFDSMDFNDFIEKLVEVFDETPLEMLKTNPDLEKLPDWDSLTALSIMAFFEEEFGIILEADDIRDVKNIKDLYSLSLGK